MLIFKISLDDIIGLGYLMQRNKPYIQKYDTEV
jgi:hypothetical protein